MSNRYSHAQVLFDRGSGFGITQYHVNVRKQTRLPVTSPANKPSLRPIHHIASHPRPSRRQQQTSSPRRIRIDSPSPPPSPSPPSTLPYTSEQHLPLHSPSPSLATEIYSPSSSRITKGDSVQVGQQGEEVVDRLKNVQKPKVVAGGSSLYEQHEEQIQTTSKRWFVAAPLQSSTAHDVYSVSLEGHGRHTLPAPRQLKENTRRLSNETAIFVPESTAAIKNEPSIESSVIPKPEQPSTSDQSTHPVIAVELSGRQPAPLPTPEQQEEESDLDFYLDAAPPPIFSDVVRPSTPPPHTRDISSSSSSITFAISPSKATSRSPQSPQSQTSPGIRSRRDSRAISISTRSSSLNATSSAPKSLSSKSTTYPTSSGSAQPLPTKPRTSLDEDLESLPSEVHSEELQYLSSTTPIPGAVSKPLVSDPIPPTSSKPVEQVKSVSDQRSPSSASLSTRKTSFDSAAPPPIGRTPNVKVQPSKSSHLKRLLPFFRSNPNREQQKNLVKPAPSTLTKAPPANTSTIPQRTKSMKASAAYDQKSKPISKSPYATISGKVKSVPYSQTALSTPPAHIAVCRTSAPSILTLFPETRGHWPRQAWASQTSAGSATNREAYEARNSSSKDFNISSSQEGAKRESNSSRWRSLSQRSRNRKASSKGGSRNSSQNRQEYGQTPAVQNRFDDWDNYNREWGGPLHDRETSATREYAQFQLERGSRRSLVSDIDVYEMEERLRSSSLRGRRRSCFEEQRAGTALPTVTAVAS